MQDWLITASTVYPHFVYIAAIVLACVEGPILSVLFGILLHLGYFNFYMAYGALMVGDLLGDTVWYWIGRRYGHRFVARFGKYLGITEEKVAKVSGIFHRRRDSILLVSKMTSGFGFALVTLVTAGMVRIPFRRYLALNLGGQFIWTGMLIALGYFCGGLYDTLEKTFGRLSALLASAIIAAIIIGISRYVRAKAAAGIADDANAPKP